jgi:hypothetical protein
MADVNIQLVAALGACAGAHARHQLGRGSGRLELDYLAQDAIVLRLVVDLFVAAPFRVEPG